jgi:hypothetical protein
MASRPKQDHYLEIGSMRPLPLSPNQYIYDEPNLPIEDARKVMFSKRQSLPNHYNIST